MSSNLNFCKKIACYAVKIYELTRHCEAFVKWFCRELYCRIAESKLRHLLKKGDIDRLASEIMKAHEGVSEDMGFLKPMSGLLASELDHVRHYNHINRRRSGKSHKDNLNDDAKYWEAYFHGVSVPEGKCG